MELNRRPDSRLTLTSARKLFQTLRKRSEFVIIRRHAYLDHPERLFSREELLTLVKSGRGQLHENHEAPSAKFGSFLFRVYDGEKRECQLVLGLDDEGFWKIIVISAFRRT